MGVLQRADIAIRIPVPAHPNETNSVVLPDQTTAVILPKHTGPVVRKCSNKTDSQDDGNREADDHRSTIWPLARTVIRQLIGRAAHRLSLRLSRWNTNRQRE